MKIEWEGIFENTYDDRYDDMRKEGDSVYMYRCKVRGGWLINYERYNEDGLFSDHIIYMPDHHHEWNPNEEETRNEI